jgi:hypothetical protein
VLVGTHPLADHGERGRRVVDTGCQLRGRARHRPRLADRRRRNRPDRQCTNIALERDVPEITRPSEAGIAKLLAPTGRRNGTPLGRTKGWAQAPQVSRSQPRKIIALGPLRPGRSNGPPAKGRWGGVNKLDRDANELDMARKALAVALLPPCRRRPG